MTRQLTREQMAAIMAAKRSGLSKRELFETDLATKKFNKLPPAEQQRILINLREGKTTDLLTELGVERARSRGKLKSHEQAIIFFEKGKALRGLRLDPTARRAFIKESALQRGGQR